MRRIGVRVRAEQRPEAAVAVADQERDIGKRTARDLKIVVAQVQSGVERNRECRQATGARAGAVGENAGRACGDIQRLSAQIRELDGPAALSGDRFPGGADRAADGQGGAADQISKGRVVCQDERRRDRVAAAGVGDISGILRAREGNGSRPGDRIADGAVEGDFGHHLRRVDGDRPRSRNHWAEERGFVNRVWNLPRPVRRIRPTAVGVDTPT